jgi:hypothetical protein
MIKFVPADCRNCRVMKNAPQRWLTAIQYHQYIFPAQSPADFGKTLLTKQRLYRQDGEKVFGSMPC